MCGLGSAHAYLLSTDLDLEAKNELVDYVEIDKS
jgi:hypothetical protein